MSLMQEKIFQKLQDIEKGNDVRILYAAESGSRAWGFASTDSDYDVRFIYIHPPGWYLTIEKKRDVIEYLKGDLDFAGWDIRKALALFRKVNPPLLEWLHSPIVYMDEYNLANQLREISKEVFNPRTCIYHYLHIAKGNFRNYLKGKTVKLKKYFYVLRPLLACNWIKEKNSFPPVEFQRVLDNVKVDTELRKIVLHLLEKKKDGTELDTGARIPVLNDFLENQINFFGDYVDRVAKTELKPFNFFDKIFRNKLIQVYGSIL